MKSGPNLDRIHNTWYIFTFRIIYEPWVFVQAYKAYQDGKLKWSNYCSLIKVIIYSFLSVRAFKTSKENKSDTTLVIVLPVYCTPMQMLEVIKKMCPQVKHIFSTRHPLASIWEISQVSTLRVPYCSEASF